MSADRPDAIGPLGGGAYPGSGATSSTMLPMTLPLSWASCASTIRASGNRAPIWWISRPASTSRTMSRVAAARADSARRVDEDRAHRHVVPHQRVEGQLGLRLSRRGVGREDAVGLEHLEAGREVGAEVHVDDAVDPGAVRHLKT